MTTFLQPLDRIVFVGDSVTDAGRYRAESSDLGTGYPLLVAAHLGLSRPGDAIECLNRGVSGDEVTHVATRWERDCLALNPTVVSLMIGINDTWRRYDSGRTASLTTYTDTLTRLLESLRKRDVRIVLMEPFVLPVEADQWHWREDLDPRIAAVRALGAEFGARLVATDGAMAQAATKTAGGPSALAADGVHPTPVGHGVLARAWLTACA